MKSPTAQGRNDTKPKKTAPRQDIRRIPCGGKEAYIANSRIFLTKCASCDWSRPLLRGNDSYPLKSQASCRCFSAHSQPLEADDVHVCKVEGELLLILDVRLAVECAWAACLLAGACSTAGTRPRRRDVWPLQSLEDAAMRRFLCC